MSVTPFQRVDSIGCLRWYKLPKNATLKEQSSGEALRSSCKQLLKILEYQKKRSAQVQRRATNSNYPTKYLSPASSAARKRNAQTERTKDKQLLLKCSKLDEILDDTQYDGMSKITAVSEDQHGDLLEEVYKEAGGFGMADSLKEIWRKDRQQNELHSDQLKNSTLYINWLFLLYCNVNTEKRGNRWSLVTIQIGKRLSA